MMQTVQLIFKLKLLLVKRVSRGIKTEVFNYTKLMIIRIIAMLNCLRKLLGILVKDKELRGFIFL